MCVREETDQLKSVIHAFEIEVKVVIRKKNHVVYLKEGAQIANLLNVMEASVALRNLKIYGF